MQAIRYDIAHREEWDRFIAATCNGTFLFYRSYMDYHKDRFEDCSLMFYENHKLKGVLPASIKNATVISHGGLTYGGLLIEAKASYEDINSMLDAALEYYKSVLQACEFVYKPVPHIYSRYPSEQDVFYLLTHGAQPVNTRLASVVKMADALPFSTLRKRHLHKAMKSGLNISENKWESFWEVLTWVLVHRHNASPVHTLPEMKMLKDNFPDHIKLLTVEHEGKVIAGTVLYLSHPVIKTQYIASDEEGCSMGALEYLFDYILHSSMCDGYTYFDFGTSMEDGKKQLSAGLNFQKEGMGGRGICYHEFLLNLN